MLLAAPPALAASSSESTPLNLPSSDQAQAASGGGSSLIRTFVGLAIVLAVIYGLYWVLKQVKAGRESAASGQGLESIATIPLGPNRSLHLVRAGREVVLLGVAEQSVVPIRAYREDEARAIGLIGGVGGGEGFDADEPTAPPTPAQTLRDVLGRLQQRTVRSVKVEGSNAVQILLLLGGVTLVPALLFTVTGFARILIVLGFIRTGLGTPTAPPNQVLVGIALFLTLFVMQPTFAQIKKDAWDPLQKHKITQVQALDRAQGPMREFMFRQTRTKDIALFAGMAKLDRPRTRADIPTYVLIPAFVISELKTAFQIGFLIFLPFLVIDLVVSSTLMSMGMVMLPPVFISLPFKILLFVLVDGWNLVTRSLVESFH